MNALIYLLSTMLMLVFAVRIWRGDRGDLTRQAYSGLAGLLGSSYLCFALYLITGIHTLRHLNLLIGALVPAAAMTLLDRLLGGGPRNILGQRLWRVGGGLVLVAAPLLFTLPLLMPAFPTQTIELPLAVWVFSGLGLCLSWLAQRLRAATDEIQRVRIGYLLVLMSAGIILSAVEGIARAGGQLLAIEGMSLQGVVPPVGAVLGAWLLFLLSRVVELDRLIDIQETLSRVVTLAAAAAILLAASVFVDGLATTPLHADFQLFLIIVVFLFVFPDLRAYIDHWVGQQVNRQGRRLEITFAEIDRALAKVITMQDLESELLGRLHASGRVPMTSLYLWDQGVYRLTLERGVSSRPLMRTIADRPFTDGFRDDEKAYIAQNLARRVLRKVPGHEDAAARIRTLEAMDAEVTLPITSGGLILGWLNLRANKLAGGFSSEELRRLHAIVDRTSVVLENLRGFDQLKEQHRLAALGTMSAGLAHEIRNPLAGIKGAAQYLQGDVTREEISDFVSLIVEETDRLNVVVSQFLAYARPFEVHPEPTDLNEQVSRTLDLVRAEGHDNTVVLKADFSEDLPEVPLDRDRFQQILLNLLHNALHAIDGSGHVSVRTGLGRLRLRAGRGRPALVVEVSDDGPGIEQSDLEKLFIPFFTTKPRGTGLGLAISRRLVEAHDGEIDVRSTPSSGSTFTIRFPLADEEPPPPDPEPAPTTEETPRPRRLRLPATIRRQTT
ncbi:MAG: two-component system sensor histidine kinase HydH [Myxococcota bacterium]|jgi:two-component system sensor histidine kinase HydH